MRQRRIRREAIIKRLMIFSFLYLIFITAHFSMITLSKYTGTTTRTGTANVAKWGVSINNNITSKDISLVAGNTSQEYKIEITSNSEVSSKYSIIISGVPNDVKVSLDGGTQVSPTGNKITFSNAGSFQATETNLTHNHTLKFDAPIDSDVIEDGKVKLDVIFVQDEF